MYRKKILEPIPSG
ncbi:hypothetical protein AYI68_g5296, partial [Smittium mucronatum]